MKKLFQNYADYYDKIYQEKDYKSEADFLKKIIKKHSQIEVSAILSLGCGTASHDILLAKSGFEITGIDQSEKMLKIAKEKCKKENVKINFKKSDVTNFKTLKKFDFSMAMFNIAGYMIENWMMEKMLENVSRSLKRDGIFAFDCWYGPAVLKSRPENKERNVGRDLIRKTDQKLDIEKSIIDINFKIIEGGKILSTENHKMRFWYLQELIYFLEKAGFKLEKTCNFMDLNSKISEENWNIFVVAKKT